MSDEPPPKPPEPPFIPPPPGNPKGSFYDQGLQPPPPPPGNPKGSFYDQGLQPPPPPTTPVPPVAPEGASVEVKGGYRTAPEIRYESRIEIMANPKGSYYDRGLAGGSGSRWKLVLFVVVLLAAGVAAGGLMARR